MRRLAIASVVAFALVLVAVPVAADDPVELTGFTTFGAVEARTGEYAGDEVWPGGPHFMDPAFNRCEVITAEFAMTGKRSAKLFTVEDCGFFTRPTTYDVVVTPAGQLKMVPQFDASDLIKEHTGCAMNGPPMYHGSFDGTHLYATNHFHGICDGGGLWGPMGIGRDSGPLHVTFGVDLHTN